MARRSYTSEVRARAARETRAAVLQAALELFAEHGYARTTVAAVADRAGVALNTLYTSVGGKPALIEELVRDGTSDEVIDTAMTAILELSDGRQILRRLAESSGEVIRRQETLLRVLLDNAAADPAVAAAAQLAVERYQQRVTVVAERLVAIDAVTENAARTAQILWFYFGTNAWAVLDQLGWTVAEASAWLFTQATHALLHPAKSASTHRGSR
jgi:AcrR family transcriptional regulator